MILTHLMRQDERGIFGLQDGLDAVGICQSLVYHIESGRVEITMPVIIVCGMVMQWRLEGGMEARSVKTSVGD